MCIYMCMYVYVYVYINICILVYYHPEGEEYEIFNMSTIQDAPSGDSTEKDIRAGLHPNDPAW